MKIVIEAMDKKSGKTYLVRSMHMNAQGEVTHINVEANMDATTWEPVEDFLFLPITVASGGGGKR